MFFRQEINKTEKEVKNNEQNKEKVQLLTKKNNLLKISFYNFSLMMKLNYFYFHLLHHHSKIQEALKTFYVVALLQQRQEVDT